MPNITAQMVKELRERTGVGMMECKRALSANEGDIEKAITALRKEGTLKAAKKSSRATVEGIVVATADSNHKAASLLEANCETDFVARDENFIAFVKKLAAHANSNPTWDAEKLSQHFEQERQLLVQKVGENVKLRRVKHLAAPAGGIVVKYVHSNSRFGSLVSIDADKLDLAYDLAMHVAALSPIAVQEDGVPAEQIAAERKIFEAQVAQSGKPAAIQAKMIAGHIKKYLADVCLLEQAFVKNPKQKVKNLIQEHKVSQVDFVRFEVGEGLTKAKEDFAQEVMQQVKGANS